MSKVHVKVNDTVYVLRGKDRGHVGKVIKVLPKENRVVVEGANMVHKHKKPTQANQQGGIIEQENPISASNVMLVDDKSKRPSKTGYKVLDNGTKVRYSKASGEDIATVSKAKK